MMDLVAALEWGVVIGQVVLMVVVGVVVLMVAMQVNLVGMEDMLVRWGRIEEIPPLGMLVVMEEALAEGMILVGMADLVRIMEHMGQVGVLRVVLVLVPVPVPTKVAMMETWEGDMEGLVEAPSMGALEEDTALVDIILMEDKIGNQAFIV